MIKKMIKVSSYSITSYVLFKIKYTSKPTYIFYNYD